MTPLKNHCLLLISIFLLFSVATNAENKKRNTAGKSLNSNQESEIDFENSDSYIDMNEAVKSKQYVRRAILSAVVDSTSKFSFSKYYINHLMGFSAVFQRNPVFSKYTSGLQGLSVGYIMEGGHGMELGLELSAISNLFAGYRYIHRPEKLSLWPFLGAGFGMQTSIIKFADGPAEALLYTGSKQMIFGTVGLLVPLVDVGIKAEFRFNFYGQDRLVLVSGIGVILFL